MNFSGSYLHNDVSFLLKIIDIKEIDIKQKESLIQNSKKHYSQMLSPEYKPTKEYLNIFYSAFELNKIKVSKHILTLANFLKDKFAKNQVLISLARGGTPVGVLLKRTLRDVFNIEVPHYSISIIRDKEVDSNALKYILQNNPNKELVFIDGWTGKGVIKKELKKSIDNFNQKYSTSIPSNLFVLADISGKADYSATNEDYLIPSSALNSTVSGLVSRSVLNEDFINDNDFHGCKYYSEFSENDLSLWYIDELMKSIKNIKDYPKNIVTQNKNLELKAESFINDIKKKFNIGNINHIKPGIGESTRVLLRRVPYAILIQDKNLIEIEHILKLASDRDIKIIENKNLLFKAVGIIREK